MDQLENLHLVVLSGFSGPVLILRVPQGPTTQDTELSELNQTSKRYLTPASLPWLHKRGREKKQNPKHLWMTIVDNMFNKQYNTNELQSVGLAFLQI